MRGVRRLDGAVALGFVLAAALEAVVRHRGTSGLLAFDVSGALWLGALALRRTRPVLMLCLIGAGGLLGTVLTAVLWPDAVDDAGVWILVLMLASYSVGRYAAGVAAVLGVAVPLLVVVGADATTRDGWAQLSGILFVTLLVGLLPTAVGRLVRAREQRLAVLHDQRRQLVGQQRARLASAVLAERLRAAERWQPSLVEGLQGLADRAASGTDARELEEDARTLLARTREEVVALTAPVPAQRETTLSVQPAPDPMLAVRAAAQPWTVLAAAAVVAGVWVETSRVLDPSVPWWIAAPGALLMGAPVALAWWRPLPAVALAWAAAAAYSRLVTPLDGSLSETAFAFAAAFGVGALAGRRAAPAGLAACWVGQLVGVGAGDGLGEAAVLLVCWSGGLAVREAADLVEQTRANNLLLARQEAEAEGAAVVAERLRLAREVHDVLGHSLTVVALQAGAARRLAASDPERADAVVRTVAEAARSGIEALASTGPEDLADLEGLVARVRATGLAVDAELPPPGSLEGRVRLVAFRVVQEALTNVLRHSPGARTRVLVRAAGGCVEVEVTCSAPTAPGSGPGSGRGLAGLRERVVDAGGRLDWGPTPEGGFGLRAVLPARRPAAAPDLLASGAAVPDP